MDFGGGPRAGAVLDRIRAERRDESEKGRWFGQLFMRLARQEPEFEADEIRRWPDWPKREELTGLDGRDIGVDLVARLTRELHVAIQCKCYDERQVLGKSHVDAFLGGSRHAAFGLRWIVATCRWGRKAESAIRNANPQVKQIDFREYLGVGGRGAPRQTSRAGAVGTSGGGDQGCCRGAWGPRPRPARDGLRHRQDVHLPSDRGAGCRRRPAVRRILLAGGLCRSLGSQYGLCR